MQQRSSRPTKTTSKVQKLLKDDGFRRSIEVSWQHNSAETEGLEVLARARALNEFIKKGLLAEVEDDTQAASARQAKQKGQHTAVSKAAAKAGSGTGPDKGLLIKVNNSPSPTTPLTSRITEKESEALLQLMLFEEEAEVCPTATSTATAPASSSSSNSSGKVLAAAGANDHQAPPPPSVEAAQAAACTAGSTDMLDDVIGLLNASGSTSCSISDQLYTVEPQAHAAKPQQPYQQQQQQQQQQEGVGYMMALPPQPACRELHRQAYVRPPELQQEDLRAAASKHASINAAWQGFYSYWGPHAACTIQQYWRAHRVRQQYLQLRAAAVALQACSRGHLLRSSERNLLRVHREEEEEQRLLLEQREQDRQLLLLQQQQQQQQQEEAAVVLQSAVRGWSARQHHMALAAAAAEQAAAATAGDGVIVSTSSSSSASSNTPSVCSRDSDSSRSSRGSSRQSHSRGSTVCSFDAQAVAGGETAGTALGATPDADAAGPAGGEAHYDLPELVIRSAVEMRTASHGGKAEAGSCCQEAVARQLVERAGQLGSCEGRQTAELGARTVMVSSSFREFQSALGAVKNVACPTL